MALVFPVFVCTAHRVIWEQKNKFRFHKNFDFCQGLQSHNDAQGNKDVIFTKQPKLHEIDRKPQLGCFCFALLKLQSNFRERQHPHREHFFLRSVADIIVWGPFEQNQYLLFELIWQKAFILSFVLLGLSLLQAHRKNDPPYVSRMENMIE